MATTEEIIDKNTVILEALINGDIDEATIAGVDISKIDVDDKEMFHLEAEGLSVYGDEIKDLGFVAHLIRDGITIAFLSLLEE